VRRMMIERTNKQDGKGIKENGWKEIQMPKFTQQWDIKLSFRRVLLSTATNMVSYNSRR